MFIARMMRADVSLIFTPNIWNVRENNLLTFTCKWLWYYRTCVFIKIHIVKIAEIGSPEWMFCYHFLVDRILLSNPLYNRTITLRRQHFMWRLLNSVLGLALTAFERRLVFVLTHMLGQETFQFSLLSRQSRRTDGQFYPWSQRKYQLSTLYER